MHTHTYTASSPRLPRRTRAAVLAVGLALAAVTGCGSTESEEAEPSGRAPEETPSSAGTPSSASTPSQVPSATSTPSQTPGSSPTGPEDEELGKVVAGAPEDLTWGVGTVPGSWRQLVEREGESQWRVTEKCVLTLQQPGGLGEPGPTQDQVVKDGIAFLESGTKVDLTPGPITRRQFPVRSNLDNVSMTTAVSVAGFTGPRGVQGQVYAHRAGEYALVLITVCSENTFAAADKSDLRPFIDDLVVQARY